MFTVDFVKNMAKLRFVFPTADEALLFAVNYKEDYDFVELGYVGAQLDKEQVERLVIHEDIRGNVSATLPGEEEDTFRLVCHNGMRRAH